MCETIDYLFIFDLKSKSWWLKIDDITQLTDYHKKTGENRFNNAFEMCITKNTSHPMDLLDGLSPEERIKMMSSRDFKYLQMAHMIAEKNEQSIIQGFQSLNIEIGMSQLNALKEHGTIYINRVGGYTFGLNYNQFYRRKELIFPDFKASDIRIKQFNNGTHYYAFMGDMQIRDGDKLK